jgi:hypothetical protein
MRGLGKAAALAFIVVPAALGGSASTLPGSWQKLPSAPAAVFPGTSVWTGKQLLVFGNVPNKTAEVTAAYDPGARTWSRLANPGTPLREPGYKALWTGKEMLVWGAFHSVAFNPGTKQWRSLSKSLPAGVIVWTGREAIGWGGGCCGDAQSNGAAYNPATNTFRRLARSPLAPSQRPLAVWTGRRLIVFVSRFDPDGKPWSSRLARAARYNPSTDTWHRIAPLPQSGLRLAGAVVWDGHEVLAVAAGAGARSALAYNPATNRWRPLASVPQGRLGATAVWTGRRVLLWGGQTSDASRYVRDGLAYDPRTNRWSALPRSPLAPRADEAVVWTGHALIIWGGEIGTPAGTNTPPRFPRDGASFTELP